MTLPTTPVSPRRPTPSSDVRSLLGGPRLGWLEIA